MTQYQATWPYIAFTGLYLTTDINSDSNQELNISLNLNTEGVMQNLQLAQEEITQFFARLQAANFKLVLCDSNIENAHLLLAELAAQYKLRLVETVNDNVIYRNKVQALTLHEMVLEYKDVEN